MKDQVKITKTKKGLRHPLQPLLEKRWSPRAFLDRPIDPDTIATLFEAARWAPSSYNEQPWCFLYAVRGEEAFDKLADCLSDNNRRWAPQAPLLVAVIAKTFLDRNGKPNRFAWYDTGQAVAHLSVQATSMDLYVHQMGGYEADRLRDAFGIGQGYEPTAMMAVGYLGDPAELPNDLHEREANPQVRRDPSEWLFHGSWTKG